MTTAARWGARAKVVGTPASRAGRAHSLPPDIAQATTAAAAPVDSTGPRVYGADRNLAAQIRCHLFVVAPNNSGSTFLHGALAACRNAWSLPVEGQAIRSYSGPVTLRGPKLAIWAADDESVALFADPAAHDWPRNRKTWYFHARAKCADASVFVEKSSQHVLQVAQLASHFPAARFLFMVRDPYAVCEGICRNYRRRFGQPDGADMQLEARAARHVLNLLRQQRHNIEATGAAWPGQPSAAGTFFTYEAMCAAPDRVAKQIRRLAPALGDLDLRRPRSVKGRYCQPLADLNASQLAALAPTQIETLNTAFRPHQALLDYFGYRLLGGAAQRK